LPIGIAPVFAMDIPGSRISGASFAWSAFPIRSSNCGPSGKRAISPR
jgi:hypothetical protein